VLADVGESMVKLVPLRYVHAYVYGGDPPETDDELFPKTALMPGHESPVTLLAEITMGV
jgi:hypothetical protein